MGTPVKSTPKANKATDQMAFHAADGSTTTNQERKEADKHDANAKATLFLGLGPRLSKQLSHSDHRQTVTPIPPEAQPRTGFNRVTLAVMPPAESCRHAGATSSSSPSSSHSVSPPRCTGWSGWCAAHF